MSLSFAEAQLASDEMRRLRGLEVSTRRDVELQMKEETLAGLQINARGRCDGGIRSVKPRLTNLTLVSGGLSGVSLAYRAV